MTHPRPIVDSPHTRWSHAHRGGPAILRASDICLSLCLATLLCVPYAASSDAGAQVYRWIDEDGNTHYTVLRGELGKRRAPAKPARLPQATDVPEPLAPSAAVPDLTRVPPDVKLGPPALQEPAVPVRTPFPEPAPVTTLAGNTDQISELETLIARDQEAIKDLISHGGPIGEDLLTDPELRQIAKRLPRLQSQLRALRGGETSP